MDCHCHLDSLDDPLEALGDARTEGVLAIVAVGTDVESSRRSVELALDHHDVWAAVGLHPHDAEALDDATATRLRDLAASPRVVAVGETGLDYYRDMSSRARQAEVFQWHISLAKELNKALVVHMREAHEDVYRILGEEGPPDRLVFHCFSGDEDDARDALDLGGHLSFAGNLSYPRSESLRRAAVAAPLDRLLVETDAPYLAPQPRRGQTNQPAFVGLVGDALASVRGVDAGELASVTTANAMRVFELR